MIEIARSVDPARVLKWLEEHIKSALTPDVSKYARGRLRVWLEHEPMLFAPFQIKKGFPTSEKHLNRLRELIGWNFDFCLVTFSGENNPVGISQHRDAGYANYEAYSWNISGTCQFNYWEGREAFGYAPNTREFKPTDPATDSLILKPGDICHFNCKNMHDASPSINRWCLNFWKKK